MNNFNCIILIADKDIFLSNNNKMQTVPAGLKHTITVTIVRLMLSVVSDGTSGVNPGNIACPDITIA